jgi:hypothetical protein
VKRLIAAASSIEEGREMKHKMDDDHHYRKLGVMFILHFVAMYMLMYAMVNNLAANVYNSLNQFYMAGLMTASMGTIELALMGGMYPNKKRNRMIIAASVVLLIGCWTFIRKQTAIGEEQIYPLDGPSSRRRNPDV